MLETVRIVNDVERLASVMARAGECPEVVLEATYGWYWAVRCRPGGANVHLARPLGVKAFECRRVKNDVRDASDLADFLRMGRLPEAWIAPSATRGLGELVRHRAKLVGLRSHCKAEVHAVLAKCGGQVLMRDLFDVAGTGRCRPMRVPDLSMPVGSRVGAATRPGSRPPALWSPCSCGRGAGVLAFTLGGPGARGSAVPGGAPRPPRGCLTGRLGTRPAPGSSRAGGCARRWGGRGTGPATPPRSGPANPDRGTGSGTHHIPNPLTGAEQR